MSHFYRLGQTSNNITGGGGGQVAMGGGSSVSRYSHGCCVVRETRQYQKLLVSKLVKRERLSCGVGAERCGRGTSATRVAVRGDESGGREEQGRTRTPHIDRRQLGLHMLLASLAGNAAYAGGEDEQYGSVSDEEWRRRLTREEYKVLRQAGTELPFSSPLYTVRVLIGWLLYLFFITRLLYTSKLTSSSNNNNNNAGIEERQVLLCWVWVYSV